MRFRGKLLVVILGITAIVAGGISSFLLAFYRKEKLAGILEGESAAILRLSEHFHSRVRLATLATLPNLAESRDVLLAAEDPCSGGAPRILVSSRYARYFAELGLDAGTISRSLDVFIACRGITKGERRSLEVVPFATRLPVPYLGLVIRGTDGRERLAVLSMEGFQTSPSSSLFVVDADGKAVWSEDGTAYLRSAMADTGTSEATINEIREESRRASGPVVRRVGKDGLLASVALDGALTMLSLTYFPTIVEPVAFATRQALFLVAGFLFLIALVARHAARLVTQPLVGLKSASEAIARGDFKVRVPVAGSDEFAQVQSAFNEMGGKIEGLLKEVRSKAELEAELQVAKSVQSLLIPPRSMETPLVAITSLIQNAAQCGGDWWGTFPAKGPEGQDLQIIMIGDATDHGVSSALMTAAVRGGTTVLEDWIAGDPARSLNLPWILDRLNRTLYECAKGKISMTFFLAIADPTARKLRCANAGHPFPFLRVMDEKGAFKLRTLTLSGTPLGDAPDTKFEEQAEFPWGKGHRLILYSDGVVDAEVGVADPFTRRDLKQVVTAKMRLAPGALVSGIMEARDKGSKEKLVQVDDITLVICDGKG